MRGAFQMERVIGIRMRCPGYPSNREADECVIGSHCESGKARRQDEAKPGDLFTP